MNRITGIVTDHHGFSFNILFLPLTGKPEIYVTELLGLQNNTYNQNYEDLLFWSWWCRRILWFADNPKIQG